MIWPTSCLLWVVSYTTLPTVGHINPAYHQLTHSHHNSVLFPTQVAYLYTTDIVKGGLISTTIGAGVVSGQFFGSWIAVPGGFLKLKVIFYTVGLCGFTASLAGSTHSSAVGEALAYCTGLMIGLLEVTISTVVTIVIDDQSEIGTAAGVFGSIRGAAGVLGSE